MSAAVAAAASAATMSHNSARSGSSGTPKSHQLQKGVLLPPSSPISSPLPLSRYESQKRRDWNTFGQYLRNHRPPLALSRCSGAHVLEFLRYLDQFGKTKQQQKSQTAGNGTYSHVQQGICNGGTDGYVPRNVLSNGAAVINVGDVYVFN
ncbi:hypothetical protein H0E87_021273 [Populus deltoides]|uniref:ALOG domain-containing protein n=1 Tax=Populus deltoides TaxID=3696 RepID=A0A8T2XRK3_POPDE|nr:hypothetical protein H0E87_021273 [Populus deltoides]